MSDFFSSSTTAQRTFINFGDTWVVAQDVSAVTPPMSSTRRTVDLTLKSGRVITVKPPSGETPEKCVEAVVLRLVGQDKERS